MFFLHKECVKKS